MLLLDEPTNHLDAESVDWLEQFLQRFPGTVVAITHDRYFLDNAAEWILELDRGRGIPYKGNYSTWLEQKEQRIEQEQKTEDARTKAMKKELEWVRQNPKGRQAKSKARLARFEELSDVDYQKRNETNEIFIPVGERLGNEVLEFVNVTKSFGDRVLIDDLSFKVPAGAIVGIIGPNGAGKSTLFRMIAGKEQPDTGTVKVGPTARMAFVDQSRESLEADKTVWQDVSGGLDNIVVGKFVMPSRAYIGRFNFKGNDTAEARRQPLGRRTRAAAPGQDTGAGRQRADARRTVRTTSTSKPCVRSKTRCSSSPAASWSSATTAGSSTASPRTSSPAKAIRSGCFFRRQLPGVRGRQEEAASAKRGARPHRLRYKALK